MKNKDRVVAISQPVYFPWCGLLNHLMISDVFVHYDDVQFARGFFNRVQAKTPQDFTWLTVPLSNHHRGQLINECEINYDENWLYKHRKTLKNTLNNAPYINDALEIFDQVTQPKHSKLSDLTIASVEAPARYLGLDRNTTFYKSSDLGIGGASSQRLIEIVNHFDGDSYITGHGALNYLNHELFEEHEIEVHYMNYKIKEYPQFFGTFTPYVTCLDAIAHLGPDTVDILQSSTLNWKDSIERPEELRA